jgi:hypothetical protein
MTMEKVVSILVALEPVIIGAIGLAALVVVPLITKAILEKLSVDQQRFAYDVAKGVVKALDLIDDKTPTAIDDALLKVAREVEAQLGRALGEKEKAAVKRAVISSTGRKVLPGA